jgi:glutathione synthase/RimK-type ligase-like ATP-grasp enzyme
MKFLIPTEPDDTHAIFVKIALEGMGHDVRFLFTADQPTRLKNSILIDNDTYQWRSTDKYDSIVENDYDVVWWRRARKPHLPEDSTHPSDYKFAVRENTLFYESLTNNMAPNARWVNSKEAATRAHSKLLQLKLAVECGMTIPTTLCSNDPQDIRYFLLKHEGDGVVYKPLCSNFLPDERRMGVAYTSKLSFLELPTNKLLQLTPGIFQKEIKKKYALRVTYFGDYIVAVKLNTQADAEGKINWRATPINEISVESYILPNSFEQQIRVFMKKMGLVFGTLDFIVSEDHEYIFLEVNEQGEFLWIEELNPEVKMLDIFIHFLLSTTKSFKWESKNAEHSIDKYKQEMVSIVAQNMRRHVGLGHVKDYN